MRRATVGGIAGIAFSVLTVVAFALAEPPGGDYSESNIADYLAKGHRPVVWVAFYLGLFGVFALIVLLAHLRELAGTELAPRTAAIFWGSGLAGAASFAAGWAVIGGQIVAHTEGGGDVVIPTPATYLISEIGVVMIFGSGGVLIGLALLVLGLAALRAVPSWVRWFTAIAGLGAVAGLAYFPFFLLIIWGIAIGIWLLVSGRRAEPAAA
jgi:hypothetical protein